MNDSWNEDNSIKNFIMEEPLSEEPKVGYVPSEIDFVFSDETNKETLIGYELNEDELLRKMKSENFPVSVKICDSFWVSDGISIDYKNWDSKTPIFISAQTGRGKNTFIEHVLIPYLKSLNYVQNTKSEILILSNRIALQTQVKDRIEKKRNC